MGKIDYKIYSETFFKTSKKVCDETFEYLKNKGFCAIGIVVNTNLFKNNDEIFSELTKIHCMQYSEPAIIAGLEFTLPGGATVTVYDYYYCTKLLNLVNIRGLDCNTLVSVLADRPSTVTVILGGELLPAKEYNLPRNWIQNIGPDAISVSSFRVPNLLEETRYALNYIMLLPRVIGSNACFPNGVGLMYSNVKDFAYTEKNFKDSIVYLTKE